MVVVQASRVTLPNSSSLSSSSITSLFYEPTSFSLALTHSDSSFSLYPSLPLLLSSPVSSLPLPQTLIPPPSSSSTFLLLQENPNLGVSDANPSSNVLFIVSSPYRGGAQILLRFYILVNSSKFARARVICKQKGLTFDPNMGVLVDSHHGVSIKLCGSVNYFTMYSISSSKIWLFAVRMVGGDGSAVKLMKCAVIDCCRPVWSVSVAFGVLILGEDNGVRCFNLWSLVKGHSTKVRNSNPSLKSGIRGTRLPNGVIGSRSSENPYNGYTEEKVDKDSGPTKQKCVKIKQDMNGGDCCYLTFHVENITELKSVTRPTTRSLKAVDIQPLSPKTFLVLDSAGDLHLLCLPKYKPAIGSENSFQLKHLPRIMAVHHFVALPDSSMRAQTVWISDGNHTIHIIARNDSTSENGENEIEEKLMHAAVVQTIFTSEKIQSMVPLAANGVLVLAQGTAKFSLSLPYFDGGLITAAYMHMQFAKRLVVTVLFLLGLVYHAVIKGGLCNRLGDSWIILNFICMKRSRGHYSAALEGEMNETHRESLIQRKLMLDFA